jgi:nicotinamidase-related amidase
MKTIMGREVLDTLDELVDPRWTAVIVVDVQNDFCHVDGHFAKFGKDVARMAPAVKKMVDFVGKAQALGMRTIFLRQASLSDARMDSPAWLRFKTRDGIELQYTETIDVNYEQGKVLPVSFDWKPGTQFIPGDYKIEIYNNGFKIGETKKPMKKGGLFS